MMTLCRRRVQVAALRMLDPIQGSAVAAAAQLAGACLQAALPGGNPSPNPSPSGSGLPAEADRLAADAARELAAAVMQQVRPG